MKLNKRGGVPEDIINFVEQQLLLLSFNNEDLCIARVDFYKQGLAKTHNKLYNALVDCMKSISSNPDEQPYDIDDIFLQLALPI